MSSLIDVTPSELSAWLCSRVCHDIISPVGAINNGLELMDEGGMDEDAMDLIRTSAINASSRLQFARIAFGAAGSAGSEIDTGDAELVAVNYMKGEKPEFTWDAQRAFLPKAQVKLLLNLILVANASIPRGGELSCALETGGEKPVITLKASGRMMRVPQKFDDFMQGRFGEDGIDAHSVQFYYTLLLSEEAGMPIKIDVTDDAITYSAA